MSRRGLWSVLVVRSVVGSLLGDSTEVLPGSLDFRCRASLAGRAVNAKTHHFSLASRDAQVRSAVVVVHSSGHSSARVSFFRSKEQSSEATLIT